VAQLLEQMPQSETGVWWTAQGQHAARGRSKQRPYAERLELLAV
jgi:hypothetical protein